MQTPAPNMDRVIGALTGAAVGDALGMPSKTLQRIEIAQHYGRITGFVAPYPDHPVSHGLQAAMVTDDTEQTLLLARLLIAHPQASMIWLGRAPCRHGRRACARAACVTCSAPRPRQRSTR